VSLPADPLAPPSATPAHRLGQWVPTLYLAMGLPNAMVNAPAAVLYKNAPLVYVSAALQALTPAP